MVSPAIKPMTADEYFARPETMLPEQLLDGELIVSPTPNMGHQRVSRRLDRLIESLMPNGEVVCAPMEVVLDEFNIPQPDVFWIAENGRCKGINGRLYGPPDLVVEVLSRSTTSSDRGRKFDLYEKHGVTEYWIVDLGLRAVEAWSLQNGVYERVGHFLSGASFESPVLGKRVETASIFPPVE